MTQLLRIRRGVGVVYILSGGLYAAAILLAAPSPLYFAHYLLFVLGGLGYLFKSFQSSRVFYYEALADFIAGLAVFVVLVSLPAVHPLACLAPGVFLVIYGLGLRRGRTLGFIHGTQD